jgi:hypothetical protein
LGHPIATSKNRNSPKAICTIAFHDSTWRCLASASATPNGKMLLRASYQLAPPTAFADTTMAPTDNIRHRYLLACANRPSEN